MNERARAELLRQYVEVLDVHGPHSPLLEALENAATDHELRNFMISVRELRALWRGE